jgi:hypothetical protein
MPGYPTRKLLFGGPETLTNAAIMPGAHNFTRTLRAVCAKLMAVFDRASGMAVDVRAYGVEETESQGAQRCRVVDVEDLVVTE